MSRIYKVTDTGDVEKVTLVFDPTTFTSLTSGESYSVVVANDINFSSIATTALLKEDASGIFYSELDFPDSQSSYFKIHEYDESAVTPVCIPVPENNFP